MSSPTTVLIAGPEQVLAERALTATLEDARAKLPDLETIRLDGPVYAAGDLAREASPSLFGGAKAVVIRDLDEGTDDLVDDLARYLAAPEPDVVLVVTHKSGNRGKRCLDLLRKGGARVIECPAIKTDGDKISFATNEFRRQGRKITPDGVRALVEAVGKDVRELESSCAQLIADTDGVVTHEVVGTYYGGRVEATGFKVADAVVAGNATEALRLLRHAIAGGDNPVPIVAVIALKLRGLVKVGAAGRGPSGQLAKQLGMAPWQIDRARKELSGWEPEALARSIQATAAADYEVKGGGRDPVYAVEHLILQVTRERAGRGAR